MSERRRRKPRVSGDSEEVSEGSGDENGAVKESEGDSEQETGDGVRESEYESAEEDEDSQEEEATHAVDEEGGQEALSDEVPVDEQLYEGEREEGDGQESAPAKEKKLDDDEDRRNPQYIPKKGTFYEHDDRTASDEVGTTPVKKDEKKKVWKENDDRWSHDKYNDADQAPKSKEELVAIYGYDIRNEEGPPRARRRRRYGRGPNKYTRNWEDEGAYARSQASDRGSESGRKEGRKSGGGSARRNTGEGDSEEKEEFPPLAPPTEIKAPAVPEEVVAPTPPKPVVPPVKEVSKVEETKTPESRPIIQEVRRFEETPRGIGRAATRTRWVEQRARPRGKPIVEAKRPGTPKETTPHVPVQRLRPPRQRQGAGGNENSATDAVTNTLGKMTIVEEGEEEEEERNGNGVRTAGMSKNPPPVSFRPLGERRQQSSLPPRMQQQDGGAANRPKRYSSQRQRSMPETNPSPVVTAPVPQPTISPASYPRPPYYDNTGYTQQAVYQEMPHAVLPPQPPPPTALPAPPPQIMPPSGYVAPPFPPPAPPPPNFAHDATGGFLSPRPGTQPPRIFAAPPVPVPRPPTGPVVPPAAPPPQYIAPNPSLINYGPPPAQYTPAPYPPFQGFAQVPQPQPPPEMYQGGITYYSTHSQVAAPRATPQKRPRAAIPILPPPDVEPRGRGRGRRDLGDGIRPVGERLEVEERSSVSPPSEEQCMDSKDNTPQPAQVAA